MRFSTRAERVPAAVLAAAGLERGESVLAFAHEPGPDEAGRRWLLGTRLAFVLVTPGEPTKRIGWESVQAADWNQDESALELSEVGDFGSARSTYRFTLDNPALLLQLIRERVTASVVLQRGYLMEKNKGFKVIGRRSPAGGPIAWMHEYDAGIDPADPRVQEAAAAALTSARSDVGE